VSWRIVIGAVAAVAVMAPAPSPARAGTASATSQSVTDYGSKGGSYTYDAIRVRYDAKPGEANDVTVSTAIGAITISDTAGIDAGQGCTPIASPIPTVTCIWGDPLESGDNLVVALGDMDDKLGFTDEGAPAPALLDGGPGNDSLSGTRVAETLMGGEGNDNLVGGARDTLIGGDGADTLWVEPDTTVSYADHVQPVRVALTSPGEAGSPGEGDKIEGHPHLVIGGRGDDRLIGTPGTDRLYGGAGADRILGGDGPDELQGGPGADTIRGERGNDLIDAGGGADDVDGGDGPDAIFDQTGGRGDHAVLRGGAGDDIIEGGPGPDVIDGGAGRDDLYGGPGGHDRLLARDGATDKAVSCSAWADRPRSKAVVDDSDMTGGCAQVDRPHTARLLVLGHTVVHLRSPTRRLSLPVGCPDDFRPAHCVGTVVAQARGSVLASGRFDLQPGVSMAAPAIVPRRILRRPGRLRVGYVLRCTDARKQPVTIRFSRTYIRDSGAPE
jgi:Ca2+-binding RTX toxin-like protein